MNNNIKSLIFNKSSTSAIFSNATSSDSSNTDNDFILVEGLPNNATIDDVGKYSIFDVANWFLSKSSMTHKKLQKLCYYAQAWCYALNNYRLEDTDYQAWIHGPVSPALYERFKEYGYSNIPLSKDEVEYKGKDLIILNDVWDTYGDKNGNELEALSHREKPWIEARIGFGPEERCNVVISPESMRNYYKSIYLGN